MKSAEIERIEAGDLFELGVDFLDQMESMYNMIKSIFDTFELGNKSISLTASGQCRLAAIAPWYVPTNIKNVNIFGHLSNLFHILFFCLASMIPQDYLNLPLM